MSNPCKLDDTTQNKVAYAMGYENGRADAIDECIKVVKSVGTDEYSYNEMLCQMEQLKEQTE